MTSVSLTLFGVVISSVVVIVIRWIIKRYQCHQVLKRYGIPGPPPNFFDGNMYELRKRKTPHKLIESWLKKYGDVFGYYMGEVPYIVINDLDIIKQVTIKDFSVFPNRPSMYMNIKPLNKTIIGLADERWKEVRSILSPTFSTSKLKLYKNIFDKKVETTVNVVDKKVKNNEIFDIYAVFQGLTLDVISHSTLAMKTRIQENPKDEFLMSLRKFIDTAHSPAVEYSVMFPILESIFTFAANNIIPNSKLNAYILGNLKKAIHLRKNNPELRSVDVLQLMIDSSDPDNPSSTKLTEEEVVANAYVTLLAGFETTASALGFTLYLLVKHPEIQEKLFEEIDKASDSSYATLQGLRYLNQVFEEALRIYPPVTDFVSRTCKQDHTIGSYTFPKGSAIVIPVWQLHHNPDLFPDPWKFDPDRFSPENKSSIKSMSYLPFGEGPRNCMGIRFAQLEAKLALFKLLKKFRFEACEKTEETLTLISPTLAINPANGVWVRAVLREQNI